MRVHLRQRIGISSISIIGGLFALLMVTATACGNPGTETSMEPTVPPPASTDTATVAPTGTSNLTPTTAATPSATVESTVTTVSHELRSDKQRARPADVDHEHLADLVGGNSEFAFDLYQNLRGVDGNLFYSPYSISLALAMTYAGARGETERQMADTLHYLLTQDKLHPAFNALDMELTSRGEGAQGKDDEGFRLNIVNAVWGQDGCTFAPGFLDGLAQSYGAGVRILDFLEASEESRVIINDWISDQTEERIKDLIPEGMISPDTVMVLTNAIYFNAAWLHQFNDRNTRDSDFHLIDGSTVAVPMMSQTENFGYASGEGYLAVELPYDGDELSMIILLPDEGRFREFEESLDAGIVSDVTNGIEYREVSLTMPKFEFESSFGLADTLKAMGMPDAFDPRKANLSGMGISGCPGGGGGNSFISNVIHKAFVLVEEEGTEAAAATAVAIEVMSARADPPIEVTVDRSFLFLIRDSATDAILFVGRIEKP